MGVDGSEDPADILRRRGLQVTAQRLAVLGVLDGRSHLTADEVGALVRARLGSVSRQAVYDVLALLTEEALLRRVQPAGSSARYERRVGDNHHHLVCRQCNRMVDVDCAVGAAPCLDAIDDAGFVIDEAEVVYWGLCPDCAAASRST